MKNRIFVCLAMMVLAIAFVLGMTACDDETETPHTHTPKEGSAVITAPNCITEGYTTYTCNECGEKYKTATVDADPNAHVPDGDGKVFAPNCKNYGYTQFHCSVCKGYYQGNKLPVDPNVHVALDEGVVTDPNCTEGGYTTYTCDYCHETVKGDPTAADPANHIWGETGADTEATCTTDGYTTYSCTKCTETYTEPLGEAKGHSRDTDGICLNCGDRGIYLRVNEEGVEDPKGAYILFGTYPQSKVTDTSLAETLTALAGTLPTAENAGEWTSYAYMASGVSADFMWYRDIAHNGQTYRGVYFTVYRPKAPTIEGNGTNSFQDDNGYNIEQVYWFRFDPIRWNIISEVDGVATLLCDMAIDAGAYDCTGGNLWAESEIRTWLNANFYQTAFSKLQQDLICITAVDNSVNSAASEFFDEESTNTDDKIYLASKLDADTCFASWEDRMKYATDYAMIQGVQVDDWDEDGSANIAWYLRSSYRTLREGGVLLDRVGGVSVDGNVGTVYEPSFTYYGICPMLRIAL